MKENHRSSVPVKVRSASSGPCASSHAFLTLIHSTPPGANPLTMLSAHRCDLILNKLLRGFHCGSHLLLMQKFNGLMAFTCIAIVLAMPHNSNGEEKPWITVVAVGGEKSFEDRSMSFVKPGTSNSNCSVLGSSVNCNTTSTPATTQTINAGTLHVISFVETETHRLKLYCSASWRFSNCNNLIVGEKFKAQIDGTKVLIQARRGGNMGKKVTLKFQLLDMRPKPQTSSDLR